jgi:hypothetical protein
MNDFSTNKFLHEILRKQQGISAEADRIFTKIVHEGKIYTMNPTQAKDIYCPWCKSNIGVACDRETWSCLNANCLQKNAHLSKKNQKIYH